MEIPESAVAKLERARHHINDLNRCIGEYLSQEPFDLVRSFDPSTHYLTLSTKANTPIPKEISLIIGDAVHNLRSALDHVYWEIMGSRVQRIQDIQFPIYTLFNKVHLLARRHVKLAPGNVAVEIENSEPHPGGKYGIYELNELDVSDKHQFPVVTGRVVSIKANLLLIIMPELNGAFSGEGHINFAGDNEEMFSKALSPLHPLAKRGRFEDKVNVCPPVVIAFQEGPFPNKEVIVCLRELADNVENRLFAIWNAR